MINANYCQLMAQYNQWMNKKLYAALAELPPALLERDDGAFFGSIIRTLNHIIHRDIRWLGWFTGNFVETDRPAESMFEDFASLCKARERIDQDLIDWAASVNDDWFRGTLIRNDKPAGSNALWVIQMFNHQTNHRAQALTLLSQSGVDIGATDIPAMPNVSDWI